MAVKGPRLEPGYGFRLNPKGTWDVSKIPDNVLKDANFSGFLTIRGQKCSVFEDEDEVQWAQKTPSSGLNVSSSLVRSAFRVAGSPSARWISPGLDEEQEDMAFVADEEGYDMPSLFEAAGSAKMRALSDADWGRLEGSSSFDVQSVGDAAGIAKSYGRDVDSIMQGIAQGAGIPAPIVLERSDGSIRLVSGNARLMAAKVLGIQPEVLWIRAPD